MTYETIDTAVAGHLAPKATPLAAPQAPNQASCAVQLLTLCCADSSELAGCYGCTHAIHPLSVRLSSQVIKKTTA
eukprot:6177178-Pleurochrysis_carterae.AAC.3